MNFLGPPLATGSNGDACHKLTAFLALAYVFHSRSPYPFSSLKSHLIPLSVGFPKYL